MGRMKNKPVEPTWKDVGESVRELKNTLDKVEGAFKKKPYGATNDDLWKSMFGGGFGKT